jgi:hypothetical protein
VLFSSSLTGKLVQRVAYLIDIVGDCLNQRPDPFVVRTLLTEPLQPPADTAGHLVVGV